MIFAKCLRSQDHTRAFLVNSADVRGWEVLEEEDDQVVRRTRLHDWHRVENAMMRDSSHPAAERWLDRDLGAAVERRLNLNARSQNLGHRSLVRNLQ